MSAKRIFILDGHPARASISSQLANAYTSSARAAGFEVRLRHLHDMEFDSDFGYAGYGKSKPLEPDLEAILGDIEWASHVVIAFPMWWGSLPAKLKGVFDRAFLPGRTFDTRKKTRSGMPLPMLSGRTARIMVTADTPRLFHRLIYRSALMHQLGGQILAFVGIRPMRLTYFSGASKPKDGDVARWIETARALGASGA